MTLREASLVLCGFFSHCRTKAGGQNRPILEILMEIRSGRWADRIGALRRLTAGSSAYEAAKKQLPAFMMSASTRTGGHKATDLDNPTGLLQLDVDALSEDEAVVLRDKLGADPHVFAAWISPGGCGVKGALSIPARLEDHRRAFLAARTYIKTAYGGEIDPHCSDPCRLCFVGHDADLRINENSSPLPVASSATSVAGFGKPGGCAPENSSIFLSPDSESCRLHNTKLFQNFPSLRPVYDRHVRRRLGQPEPGHRNRALVELAAGLFCVIHPKFILEFAEVFHQTTPTFRDYPHEDLRREVESTLSGCQRDYLAKSLSPPEAKIYIQLRNEAERTAFRICRSLAMCESDPSFPPPLFFLSAVQLGCRIDELMMTAWRILQALEKRWGAIQKVEIGKKRAAGQKSMATKWRWNLHNPDLKGVRGYDCGHPQQAC